MLGADVAIPLAESDERGRSTSPAYADMFEDLPKPISESAKLPHDGEVNKARSAQHATGAAWGMSLCAAMLLSKLQYKQGSLQRTAGTIPLQVFGSSCASHAAA